jgi:predicted HicB family RNase H-like nuclease
MSASTVPPPRTTMAKPKRNDVPVKVDEEVVRLARIVAAYRGESLAEYMSETLRPIVQRHLAKYAKQVEAGEDE